MPPVILLRIQRWSKITVHKTQHDIDAVVSAWKFIASKQKLAHHDSGLRQGWESQTGQGLVTILHQGHLLCCVVNLSVLTVSFAFDLVALVICLMIG